MPVTQAPFDRDGNMQSYPTSPQAHEAWRTEMREVPPFNATMRIVGMETGRSAKRLVLEDQTTGARYPMFVADVVRYLSDVDLTGVWGPIKRGQNYGIKKVG